MTTGQVLGRKGAEARLDATFGVVDNPLLAAEVNDVALGWMSPCQGVRVRIDAAPVEQVTKASERKRASELNHLVMVSAELETGRSSTPFAKNTGSMA